MQSAKSDPFIGFDAGALDRAKSNFEKPIRQVILSLRENLLPDLEGLKQEMPALIHNGLRLKKLNGIQALEVVTCPVPLLLVEGVAEKIVEFVAGAAGAPPSAWPNFMSGRRCCPSLLVGHWILLRGSRAGYC